MIKPVYIFNGLLDSGKTSVIKETLLNPNFNEGEKTLILAFEEGEESYDKAFLKASNSEYLYLDSIDLLTQEKMQEIEDQYYFERLFIECNGIEDEIKHISETGLLANWEIAQVLCMIDGSQFKLQVNNLKTFLFNHIKIAECIIINRYSEDYPFFRNNILGLNPKAELIFENLEHEIEDFSDYELFDMSQDEINIKDIDYGKWYVDCSNKASKYSGKKLTMKVYKMAKLEEYEDAYIMGRKAMVCCADDIVDMGLTMINIDHIEDDKCYEVSGIAKLVEAEDGYDTIVLDVLDYHEVDNLEDEMIYFN